MTKEPARLRRQAEHRSEQVGVSAAGEGVEGQVHGDDESLAGRTDDAIPIREEPAFEELVGR